MNNLCDTSIIDLFKNKLLYIQWANEVHLRKLSNSSFPLDKPELLKKWRRNLGKDDSWQPSERSLLCSRHFEKSCVRIGKDKRVSLKEASVPTLFGENENDTNYRGKGL